MFDLESAIANWKRSLTIGESFSPEDINELESHLRDCVSTLESNRLSAEETFLIAQRRVGRPSELATEFAKESPGTRWIHRFKWMCIGVLALVMIRGTADTLYGFSRLFGWVESLGPWNEIIAYNITAITCSWLVVFAGVYIVLRHDGFIDRITQRFARIPSPVLFGLPLAVIAGLGAFILIGIYSPSSQHMATLPDGQIVPLPATVQVVSLAFDMSPPTLLLVAAYVLHRSGQRRAFASPC